MSTHHHMQRAVALDLKGVRKAVGEVEGVNAKIAVIVTSVVGTMWCAYVFCLLALLSLPDILIQAGVLPASAVPHLLANPGLILVVAWVAQTFIQLVLLSVIMVGQSVQSNASDARSEKTEQNTEMLMQLMDAHTQGGLGDILAAIERLTPTTEVKQ